MYQNPKGLKRERDEEEMEELSFIPRAVSEPRLALQICDNTCTKEGFKFFQIAAIVVEGGGELVQAMLQCNAAETR